MRMLQEIFKKIKYRGTEPAGLGEPYEFCPRCDANLTLQTGYSNDFPYWVCKGCGETLINPEVPGNIAWICDECEAMLNVQEGFSDECDEWICTECGFANPINKNELYYSEAEFKAAYNNPYRGLSDEEVLELLEYNEIDSVAHRDDIIIVKNIVNERLYVKKYLCTYDVSVYEYLKAHPIDNMPRIKGIYESANYLIVIEEFIQGKTLLEIINNEIINQERAVKIAKSICHITSQLHGLDKPIIHRDIKPSNIIITDNEEVFLLDMNVAKWYKEGETEDTQLIGTQYYAAPEQWGYGFSSSGEKADIYAIGMLLNVMVTGKLPKKERATGEIWNIVEHCICLEPNDRYSDKELIATLERIEG